MLLTTKSASTFSAKTAGNFRQSTMTRSKGRRSIKPMWRRLRHGRLAQKEDWSRRITHQRKLTMISALLTSSSLDVHCEPTPRSAPGAPTDGTPTLYYYIHQSCSHSGSRAVTHSHVLDASPFLLLMTNTSAATQQETRSTDKRRLNDQCFKNNNTIAIAALIPTRKQI
jgi:hypothetical protein